MARVTAMQAVELKTEKAQEVVSSKKKEYDAAIADLSDLLDNNRDPELTGGFHADFLVLVLLKPGSQTL